MALWTVWDYPGELVPEPIWILLKHKTVSGTGVSWTLGKSASRPRQITIPAPTASFFQAICLSFCLTNSVKALKASCITHKNDAVYKLFLFVKLFYRLQVTKAEHAILDQQKAFISCYYLYMSSLCHAFVIFVLFVFITLHIFYLVTSQF